MLFSVVAARAAVVRVPELTNAVVGGYSGYSAHRSQQHPNKPNCRVHVRAGLVASCACCTVIPIPIAPLVGFVAALLTLSFEELLARFQIDDAVGAAP